MKKWISLLVVLIVAGLGLVYILQRERPIEAPQISCSEKLNRDVLEKSLELGSTFLLNNQKEEGNFFYEYNWKTGEDTQGDNQVRQAGAAWGLALVFQQTHQKEVEAALLKALDFFSKNSQLDSKGNRFIVYPGDKVGRTGTVALASLALIDYLRSPNKTISPEQTKVLKERLDQYLGFLLSAQMPSGLWHSNYNISTGKPFGRPSPYFDGENLLALIKAYNYLGRKDLKDPILKAAAGGYQKNIVEALKQDPDSKITKGYFQWSSMSFFEMTQSDLPGKKKYGNALIRLADWMIDVHRTLDRTRNTGYAYEGIIPAYKYSLRKGDKEHAEKFKCVIDKGLEKLTSWQVGSPIANFYVQAYPGGDARATGGVQNHRKEPKLRIDVAQHQMHAVILALNNVYP